MAYKNIRKLGVHQIAHQIPTSQLSGWMQIHLNLVATVKYPYELQHSSFIATGLTRSQIWRRCRRRCNHFFYLLHWSFPSSTSISVLAMGMLFTFKHMHELCFFLRCIRYWMNASGRCPAALFRRMCCSACFRTNSDSFCHLYSCNSVSKFLMPLLALILIWCGDKKSAKSLFGRKNAHALPSHVASAPTEGMVLPVSSKSKSVLLEINSV